MHGTLGDVLLCMAWMYPETFGFLTGLISGLEHPVSRRFSRSPTTFPFAEQEFYPGSVDEALRLVGTR